MNECVYYRYNGSSRFTSELVLETSFEYVGSTDVFLLAGNVYISLVMCTLVNSHILMETLHVPRNTATRHSKLASRTSPDPLVIMLDLL